MGRVCLHGNLCSAVGCSLITQTSDLSSAQLYHIHPLVQGFARDNLDIASSRIYSYTGTYMVVASDTLMLSPADIPWRKSLVPYIDSLNVSTLALHPQDAVSLSDIY